MAGRADLDLYNVLLGFGWARERVELVKATLDPSFLVRARRALFPLPGVDRRAPVSADVFPPYNPRPLRRFEGERVAMIAGGGAGACVSLIGVRRAFEEAGIEPELIVSCSGGTIWGSMWAAGMSAQEMADFSLSWELEDYLDIQWGKVPRYAAAALKGFTGLARRTRRALGDRLIVIDAADHRLLRGPAFYDLFIDRSRWPALIRAGYDRATTALDTLRSRAHAHAGVS
jgi:hypothetical protein